MANETNSRKRKREHREYGLMEVEPSTEERSGRDLSSGVDVIFVHGLGSNRTKAWSATIPRSSSNSAEADPTPRQPEDIIWVRDFLSTDLKQELRDRARFYLYGYNSSWMFDAPTVDVHSLAQNLLDTVEAKRQQEEYTKSRRIIFVAHSHGGLLVKEALVIDASPRGSNTIASRTDAILFFGTPHQGSNLADFGQVISRVLGIWGSDASLLESLKPGHNSLWNLHEHFTAVLEQRLVTASNGPIRVINFYEELKTTILDAGAGIRVSHIVVDKQSATFQFAHCKNLPLQRDHKQLSKFNQRDTDYNKVLMTLTTCIEKSLNLTRLDNPVQPSYSEDVKTACLQSLSFRNIDSRRHDIASAHQNTCDWLFATAQFQQWQNRGDPKSYNGVLWIKGKPGAGKSTLMKHALLHYQNSFSGHAVAAYFFNARGDALEKSPLGMLRSVLYQLLEQTPQSCNRFIPLFLEKQRKHGKDWMWYSEELKGFLLEMMHHQPRPILLFVDALDECDESEVRDVVSFLERLSLAAIGSETSLGICLSSRHYPTISMGKMLELVVEQRAEHDRDISIYVQDKLKMRDETTESELLQKANGIFMWIILVTEMLNQAIDEGRITAMRKKLREVPGDLDEVFRILLEKDNPYKHETILILQWVLFAKRPLKPKELYFAVIAGTEPEGFEPWCLSKVTNQTVRRFITTSSRGLIEIRENDFSRTTQFIHESVNDFLLRNRRLQTLDPTLAPHIVGTSHNRLANCCLSHIEMELLDPSARIVSYELDQKYPFLRYASAHMLHHAEQAHTGRITQPALSQRLQHESDLFERFKSFHNSFERTSMTYGKEVKLLYVVSLEKCRGLAQTILLEPSIDVNAQGGHYGNALQAAAATRDGGHFVSVATVKEIIQILLDAGADVDAQGGHYGNALQAAADNQFSPTNTNNEIIQVLLDAGADVNAQGGYYGNALQAATTHPNFAAEKVIKMLLDAGADVNAQGGYYGNALQAATNGAARSHSTKEVTQMLLDAGADVNAQGGYHGNALQAAVAATGSHFGYATAAKEVVQMLLDAGADANAQGGRYGNVLQAAAAAAADSEFTASYSNGYNLVVKEVIQMLLDAGANVNAQGGHYGNVLQATAAIIPAGHSGYITVAKEVIQMLLDAGADVNAQGGYHGNALQAAAAPGGDRTSYTTAAKDIIQMLLDAGADVNSQGGHYGNALQAAAAAAKPSFAAKEIIQIFLDARADVNAQGGYYGNALQAADAVATAAATWPVSAPDKGIVQMLLDAGAVDVNDQDEDCSNTDTV